MKDRSKLEKLPRKWQSTIRLTKSGCWQVPAVSMNNRGYPLGWDSTPREEGGQKVATKHRIAWKVVTGKSIPNNREVHHKCRNQRCINPDHLQIVTKEQHRKIHAAD